MSKMMLDWVNRNNSISKPIVISAIRDILLVAESQLVNKIMIKTSSVEDEYNNSHVDNLMNSLKNSTRNIEDILKNIKYLQQNIGQTPPFSKEQTYDIANKTTTRLAQLRDEAVIIKDYQLANEIDELFDAIGIL